MTTLVAAVCIIVGGVGVLLCVACWAYLGTRPEDRE